MLAFITPLQMYIGLSFSTSRHIKYDKYPQYTVLNDLSVLCSSPIPGNLSLPHALSEVSNDMLLNLFKFHHVLRARL